MRFVKYVVTCAFSVLAAISCSAIRHANDWDLPDNQLTFAAILLAISCGIIGFNSKK